MAGVVWSEGIGMVIFWSKTGENSGVSEGLKSGDEAF